MKPEYDFLLVGAGLFNAIFAREASRIGKKCLVIEKRNHVGGNLYCKSIEGINVHHYGAHIFHTHKKHIWEYMRELCEFNHYVNSPVAKYKNELYNLPFNMNTFNRLWGVISPIEALERLERERIYFEEPQNLEEQALSLVGKDIYEKLIKGYTEKQWGRNAADLPSFIIKRIPIRLTYNNNYFNDPYQGIPIGGYNKIFQECFRECDIYMNTDYLNNRELSKKARTVIYTGMIDQYYDYCFGSLEYRSLLFENEIHDIENYQGNAVVNYTEREIPYTRIIEHKHFEFGEQSTTVITKEYPQKWEKKEEPYYPINSQYNVNLYRKYQTLAHNETNTYFGGRLGSYQYYDMDDIVEESLNLFNQIIDNEYKDVSPLEHSLSLA